MGTKTIKKILSWYRDNRRYQSFFIMIVYALWLPLMLFVMIMSGHTYFDAWIIFALNVCIGFGSFKDWRIEKWNHKYNEYLKDVMNSNFELLELTSQTVRRWQDRTISANRRRKRAECRLKRCVKALRIESVDRRDNELVAYKQRTMLTVTYKALVEGNDEARQKAVQECALSGELNQTPCDFTPLFHESVGEITTSNNV